MARKEPSLRAGSECPAQPATHPVTVRQCRKSSFKLQIRNLPTTLLNVEMTGTCKDPKGP